MIRLTKLLPRRFQARLALERIWRAKCSPYDKITRPCIRSYRRCLRVYGEIKGAVSLLLPSLATMYQFLFPSSIGVSLVLKFSQEGKEFIG